MGAFAYVGNAVDAAGYRLAGIPSWAPDRGAELAAFRAARANAEAVFITVAVAEHLPRAELDAALAGDRPVVVLIPESADASPLEPAERVRAQLGLEP
jgi:vacuolar-type H+-ATPase subunit F/Vma7